jgi:hypothetical protein
MTLKILALWGASLCFVFVVGLRIGEYRGHRALNRILERSGSRLRV